MNFGNAIESMKEGKKVSREGWNGKGMYLYNATCELPYPPLNDGSDWGYGAFPASTFIVMKTADEKLIPWLASQTDILADDWGIID